MISSLLINRSQRLRTSGHVSSVSNQLDPSIYGNVPSAVTIPSCTLQFSSIITHDDAECGTRNGLMENMELARNSNVGVMELLEVHDKNNNLIY